MEVTLKALHDISHSFIRVFDFSDNLVIDESKAEFNQFRKFIKEHGELIVMEQKINVFEGTIDVSLWVNKEDLEEE